MSRERNTINLQKKSLFEEMIQTLPLEIQKELIQTDGWLKAIKPLKFRRTIDRKAHKITYVASDYGVSYLFKIEKDQLEHRFQWYIVYNGKPETWHRKADYMEETLERIAEEDYGLAVRIYQALKQCPGGENCHGERCLARTVYAFKGEKILTCHGSVHLQPNHEDFEDAREFFHYFNELVKEKEETGESLPEKIILCQTKRSL